MEYDFILQPGADPSDIRMEFEGLSGLEIDSAGKLAMHTHDFGIVYSHAPVAFQLNSKGEREIVGARYQLIDNQVSFELDPYDPHRKLTIDPILSLTLSTFVTGFNSDGYYFGVDRDAAGNIFLAGLETGANFPTTTGAYDETFNGGGDVVVAKMDPSGNSLLFATYIGGGHSSEQANACKVSSTGEIYVCGFTVSNDFPTTPGCYANSILGGVDAFFLKLSGDGSSLLYSTYYGGTSSDDFEDLEIGPGGEIYLAGESNSADFPVTAGAYDQIHNGSRDITVTKINAAFNTLIYSTFIGGFDMDLVDDMEVNAAGEVFVSGRTQSGNFPRTPGAYDNSYAFRDGYISKLNASGSALAYSTLMADDFVRALKVRDNGDLYFCMLSQGAALPTAGAYDPGFNGGTGDLFVGRLNATGTGLTYGTFLGGANFEEPYSLDITSGGNVIVVGSSESSDYPTTADAFDNTYHADFDLVISVLDSTLTNLCYSTYMGGDRDDYNTECNIHIYNNTELVVPLASHSINGTFPTTPGAFLPTTDVAVWSNIDDKQVITKWTINSGSFNGCTNPVLSEDGIALDVKKEGENARLKWRSGIAGTKNIRIQRSFDGTNFERISEFQHSEGLAYDQNILQFKDRTGVLYYRAIALDQDGGAYPSEIELLFLDDSHPNFSTFPNPANDRITLVYQADDIANGEIYDMLGRKMMEFRLPKGRYDLDVSGLKRGMYSLQLKSKSGKIETRELLLQ